MAQFARPSSDVVFTILGATPIDTAGDRYQNVDESTPNDTDYVYSQNNPSGSSSAEFGLSSITDPGVDTGHVLRIRTAQIDEDSGTHPMGANTGGTATSLAWELRQGATVIQSGSINPGAFATTTINLTDTNVTNITNYSDLRVDVNPSGGGGSPANRRAVAISWIELEVPDAPTVVTDTFTLNAYLLAIQNGSLSLESVLHKVQEAAVAVDAVVLVSQSGTWGIDAEIEGGATGAVWTTPSNLVQVQDLTPTLAFNSPTSSNNMHFEMQLDTVDTFDSGDLRTYRSFPDPDGWEFDDGGWLAVPATGLDPADTGSEVRFTIPTPLDTGVWFRRVRASL